MKKIITILTMIACSALIMGGAHGQSDSKKAVLTRIEAARYELLAEPNFGKRVHLLEGLMAFLEREMAYEIRRDANPKGPVSEYAMWYGLPLEDLYDHRAGADQPATCKQLRTTILFNATNSQAFDGLLDSLTGEDLRVVAAFCHMPALARPPSDIAAVGEFYDDYERRLAVLRKLPSEAARDIFFTYWLSYLEQEWQALPTQDDNPRYGYLGRHLRATIQFFETVQGAAFDADGCKQIWARMKRLHERHNSVDGYYDWTPFSYAVEVLNVMGCAAPKWTAPPWTVSP